MTKEEWQEKYPSLPYLPDGFNRPRLKCNLPVMWEIRRLHGEVAVIPKLDFSNTKLLRLEDLPKKKS